MELIEELYPDDLATVDRAVYSVRPAASAGEGAGIPVVFVIHDIFGPSDHTRDVGRRVAEAGYVAVVPDLYARGDTAAHLSRERLDDLRDVYDYLHDDGGWANEEARERLLAPYDPERREHIYETFRATAPQAMTGVPRDDSGRVALLNDHAARYRAAGYEETAVIGFCLGGALAFAAACSGPYSSVVDFYGRGPAEAAMAGIECPVLGLYGEEDVMVTSTTTATALSMARAGKDYTKVVYHGTPHAFFDDSRPSFTPKAARDAWARTLSFLRAGFASPAVQVERAE